jgi:repressor LexA
MKGLTDRQREVMTYILACYQEGGPLPTLRDIAQRFQWASPNAAFSHVFALEKKGVLRRSGDGESYGIVLGSPDVVSVIGRRRKRRV